MAEFFKLFKIKMSEIYIACVFIGLTFYMNNGYYNTLQAKGTMLFSISLFYVLSVMAANMILFILGKNRELKFWKKCNAANLGILCFGVFSLISTIFADDKKTAFWGSSGCRMGSAVLCLLCLASVFLSQNMRFHHSMVWMILFSGYIVFLWGLASTFQVDFMGWYTNMASNPYDYLSTIGNRNWYAGYLALQLSFVAVLFLYNQRKKMDIFYMIYLFLGFLNLYISKNDGNILIFGCVIPVVYCSLKSLEKWKRFTGLLWIFIIAGLTVKVMCIFVNPLFITGDTIFALLQSYHWYLPLAVLTICLQIKGKKIVSMHLEKIWLGFSVLIIIGMIIVMMLCYDNSFGSNRGYIWSYAGNTFVKSNLRQKWLGWGPDCFKKAIYTMDGDNVFATWKEHNQIANAHNEILQYLITMGILGMISYLVMFFLIWRRAVKRGGMLCTAAGTAVFTYFCTVLVYNPQPLNYAILFVMFAIVGSNKC